MKESANSNNLGIIVVPKAGGIQNSLFGVDQCSQGDGRYDRYYTSWKMYVYVVHSHFLSLFLPLPWSPT